MSIGENVLFHFYDGNEAFSEIAIRSLENEGHRCKQGGVSSSSLLGFGCVSGEKRADRPSLTDDVSPDRAEEIDADGHQDKQEVFFKLHF